MGYEILKLHDADPRLGVEVKFVDAAVCRRFLESYSSGAVRQSLTQHSCRLLTSPLELEAETELRAGTHTLDNCPSLELCLQHIHQAQVRLTVPMPPLAQRLAPLCFVSMYSLYTH